MTKENSQDIEIKLEEKDVDYFDSNNMHDSSDSEDQNFREAYGDYEPINYEETAVDEASITPDHIDMVVEFTGCTKQEAIQALILSNDDV